MIRVVIVDDQKVVTQGLKVLLEAEPDIEIIGTGSNGQEAIDLATELLPDVLLIDQHMPIMDGVQATQAIASQFPQIAILLLSGSDRESHIADALRAGAKGYLLKSTSAEDLANSIRSVDRGYSQMGPGLLEKLLANINPLQTSASPTAPPRPQSPLLSSDLSRILSLPSQFDADLMMRLLDATHEASEAAALMAQLEQQLQQQPTHVSALYLSGQLICKFQPRDRRAMNYFRLAFTHAQSQRFSPTIPLQICRAAWAVNAEETLSWLTGILNSWPTDRPNRILFDSMSQVFGATSEPCRWLRAIWEMQHLNLLCEQANTLKSKLRVLDASA
ncbi:response regulator transcription factor [Altericista sp. CCNU0014]|uniref:response regulator n=1 Tax=Altericista sp. CCNU0014 TaxID=3082949 RepID=UPI00384B701D